VTALRNLLDRYPVAQGIGASGVNFFPLPPGASADDRRDIAILGALSNALSLLAGPAFRPVFGDSTDQMDYLWGKLHRVTFAHPLGGPFSIPPAGGAFGISPAFPPPLGPTIPGVPTDGGFGAVDASNHDARAQSYNSFMFTNGPVNRFAADASGREMRAESVWPGGTSGVLGSPFYFNLLPLWLTNDTIPLLFRTNDVQHDLHSVSKFVPAK